MGYKDIGCMGSSYYKTPHIDQLANEGVLFTNAYSASPVCSPARASILTGKYPATIGMDDYIPGRGDFPWQSLKVPENRQQLPLSEVTMAEAFKAASYNTAFMGKWHLGGEGYLPEDQGFDINIAGNEIRYAAYFFLSLRRYDQAKKACSRPV